MTEQFIRLAPYLKDPLVLIGFFLLIAFLFSRYLVKKGIIQPLPRTLGYRILRSILLYGFILGLFIIVLGYVLKRQELIGQQRTAEHLEMLLREATKGAPGSDGEKSIVIQQIIENYLSGDLTREQVETMAQDIKISPTQAGNYPLEYRLSSNQSNSRLQQRSHATPPGSGNRVEAKTISPLLSAPGPGATSSAETQSGGSSIRETSRLFSIPSPQKDQTLDVACLICGCQPGGDISKDLIEKAWGALNANQGGMNPKNFEKALACTKVTIIRFAGDADEQQAARLQAGDCKKTPAKEEKERDAYFASSWALSDIAAAWFIRGQSFERQRNCAEAKEAYKTIIARYNCAYIWDPRGWFWNAAKGADQALKNLEANECTGKVQ